MLVRTLMRSTRIRRFWDMLKVMMRKKQNRKTKKKRERVTMKIRVMVIGGIDEIDKIRKAIRSTR